MVTKHIVINMSASNMRGIGDASIALVVTSPPYPMIEMWDDCFFKQNGDIKKHLQNGASVVAFEEMHQILDQVWHEVDRVLMPGGIVCINIGDATRTVNDMFQIFSNHSRIISTFLNMGYCILPDILWRKPSNAPNKFMGSGMYPGGAYVTYEHEYILIFRKGGKRVFGANKSVRQKSAYFWEERNVWFSDLWEIKGVKQNISGKESRKRSAAFPFEIPYRLINMYSIYGDTVLDPFVGTGTTLQAAIASCRNSIGIEIDAVFSALSVSTIQREPQLLGRYTTQRIQEHQHFIDSLTEKDREKCYRNENYPFLVKTKQEIKTYFPVLQSSEIIADGIECQYSWPEA